MWVIKVFNKTEQIKNTFKFSELFFVKKTIRDSELFGPPQWLRSKRTCLQCGSFGFNPWVRKMGMATHSSIFAWKIPWTEEPGGQQSMGLQEWNTTEET